MAVMTLRLVLHCFMAYRSMSVSGLVAKARVRTSPATDTRLGVVEDCGDWPGNHEKPVSSGCALLWMSTSLDRPYSPYSEGYSRVTFRCRD